MTFVISLIIAFGLVVPSVFAADDGFGGAETTVEGQHFTLLLKPGVDAANLASQLNISATDEQLANQRIDNSSATKQLASMLDVLFNRASDVLDMHVYSFKGSIKVFANPQELHDFFFNMYHKELPCTGVSFYLADYNSIYSDPYLPSRSYMDNLRSHL